MEIAYRLCFGRFCFDHLFCFCLLVFYSPHMSEIIWYVPLSDLFNLA